MVGINQIEFDQIFNDWYYPVRNFVYYKTGDMQTAEDITQDTFLKVWEKRESIDPSTVKSLLYTIANNLFLNIVEHNKVVLKFESNYSGNPFSSSPDYEMELKEFDQKLKNSLNQMDERNRTVFLMNRIDDLTYNEIAHNLGLSVKAVEKRMSKALSFLKVNLKVDI